METGPYYHYRLDSRHEGGERETILDPRRLGIQAELVYGRILQVSWSLEEVRSGGVHEGYQQQGRLAMNYEF